MVAEILSIGTEILLGEIINTNASFLAEECAALGISVYRQTVVGDNEERILQAFRSAFDSADLVIASGGLGPTQDDLSRECAALFFQKPLKLHEPSLEKIRGFFKKLGRTPSANNEKQAFFPEGGTVLENPRGTAPGLWFEEGGKILVLLPGPPREMSAMWKNGVKPKLEGRTGQVLFSRTLRVFGVGEGEMAQRTARLIEQSRNPTVAPYAKDFESTLRITARASSEQEALRLIDPVEAEIREILGDAVYGLDETSLEVETAKLLLTKKLTLATAESCTGGLIAAKLISWPGISSCFMESRITYSNDSKISSLGVRPETLNEFGAVSEETVREMAGGMAKISGADIVLAVSGVAGPGGGTDSKPVGTVYGALYFKGALEVRRLQVFGGRDQVRHRSALMMLDWLRRVLLKTA